VHSGVRSNNSSDGSSVASTSVYGSVDRDVQALSFLQQQVETVIRNAIVRIAKEALRAVRAESRRSAKSLQEGDIHDQHTDS
jgi:hypothetical protein